jgi:hypothetical protein
MMSEQFLKIKDAMDNLEVTERDWIKNNFLELARRHKATCQGCGIWLLSLRIALERLGIQLTHEEYSEFS